MNPETFKQTYCAGKRTFEVTISRPNKVQQWMATSADGRFVMADTLYELRDKMCWGM